MLQDYICNGKSHRKICQWNIFLYVYIFSDMIEGNSGMS